VTATVTETNVACRAVSALDEPFLRRVYAGTRERELAMVPWSDEQKAEFVNMQFDAQARYYLDVYADASYEVIEVEGVPAGRLYLAELPAETRIVDITLIQEYRGRGIGTKLLGRILDRARAAGRSVSIHVELENPARRLYERLGFAAIAQHGIYTLMEWRS
jgi:ribosomal protein S18 acetylase RimI-like enzyme